MRALRIPLLLSLAAFTAFHSALLAADKQAERLQDARNVFQEIMDTADNGIPQDLLDRAACIAIIPGVKKAAFIFGGRHGAGYVLCRKDNGTGSWGSPSGFSISGGSFGLQIGVSETDFILLFMNTDGIQKLIQDKFTLGADAAVAAGPVGRNAAAATDAQMTAKVLSYSRSKGVFAGLSLEGAVLRPSADDNKELYGRPVAPRAILLEHSVAAPAKAQPLIALLNKYSPSQSKKPL